MITIAAAGTLQGTAGTNTAITCTVTGLESSVASGEVFKVLDQRVLTTSVVALYTVPASTTAFIKEILLSNTTASPVASVKFFVNGAAAGNQIVTMTIPANGTAVFDAHGWKVYDGTGFLQYAGATGPQGAKGARWLGAYSGGTAYVVDDIVFSGGSAWINILGSTGAAPPTLPTTSNTNWNAVSIKGDQGLKGATWRGAYSGATAYVVDDLVSNQNSTWINILGSTGTAPPTLPTTANSNWSLVAKVGDPGTITTVAAGAGLTGGGSAASVTVDAVAGDGGLYVAADAIYTSIVFGGLITGASKTFAAGDRGKYFQRSNSGSAMTDTMPSLTNTAADIGFMFKIANAGTVVAEKITLTTPAGTFTGGSATYDLQWGCRQTFIWTGTIWVFDAGNGNIPRWTTSPPYVAGNLLSMLDTTGRVVQDSGVPAANVVQTTRTVAAGGALTGGGDLSANRTISLATNAVDNTYLADMATQTFRGRNTAGTGDPEDLSAATAKTMLNLTGTNSGDQTISITGDVTGSGSTGAIPSTVAAIRGVTVTTTAPVNGQVLQYINTTTTAGTQGWVPYSYAGDVGGGPSASVVTGIRGVAVSAAPPLPGQNYEYIAGSGWTPSDEQFNVISYGADPTNTGDSTLAIYNALVACAIARTSATSSTVFSTAQTTTSASSFTISVGTNTLAASGTLIAQSTLGGVLFTYTGGGSTTLTCAVTKGIAGGLLLSGSMIGIQNGFAQGGTVYFPAGLYKVTQQIIISFAGVQLLGPAGSAPSDASGVPFYMLGGAFLNWGGAAGGIVIVGMPWTGTTMPQLQGFSVRNLNISCQGTTGYGLAAGGIMILSGTGFALENIMVYDPAQFAFAFDVLSAGSLATGTAHDCTRFTVKNLKFRCLEQAPGGPVNLTNPAAVTNLNALSNSTVTLSGAPTNWPNTGNDLALFQAVDQLVGVVVEYLVKYTGISGSTLTGCTTLGLMPNESNSGAGPGYLPNSLMFAGSTIRHASSINATGIRLHGSATANTCCAAFIQLTGQYGNGPAMSFLNCDSNIIYNPMFNRNGTGIGIELHGSTAGAIGTCRNNAIYSGSAGAGGIRARGTGAVDLNYAFPSQDNYWYNMEVANGEPSPTIGLGATLFYSQNGTVNANPQLGTLTGDRLITGRMTTTQVIAGTTQAAITGLSFPIIQPGVQYEFESMVLGNVASTATAGTGGLMLSVSVPVGATLQCAMIGQTGAASSKTTFVSTNSVVAIGAAAAALTAPVLIKGVVFAGTATSHTGTVQINASSASGTASTISNTATIQAGSYLRAVKVG